MVPRGWREGRVRDLVKSLNAGVSVNSEDDGNLNSSYKILKTSCVSKGIFDPNETKSVVEKVEISRLKEPVLCDSIIISRMNTPALVGANGYIENGIENTYLPDRLWQAKPKSNDVNMKWLGYWFASSHTRYTLSSTATGTSGSMKNITKSDVLNIKIDIPPLLEQRKIAKILSTWDKAISTTERLIDNSKQQKKALMQQLLTGKKRLLDDSGKPFEGEWEWSNLDKVCDIKGGKRLPKGNSLTDIPNTHPYIRVADMHMGGIDTTNILYVPLDVVSSIKNYTIAKDDLFITVAGTLGIVGEVPAILDGANLTENADKLTNISCNKKFLLYVLKSPIIQRYVDAESTQNAQPKLALTRIRSFKIPLPSSEEQQRIASVLANADKETELKELQLSDLKQEKKALMQQLLTGKRRVEI